MNLRPADYEAIDFSFKSKDLDKMTVFSNASINDLRRDYKSNGREMIAAESVCHQPTRERHFGIVFRVVEPTGLVAEGASQVSLAVATGTGDQQIL